MSAVTLRKDEDVSRGPYLEVEHDVIWTLTDYTDPPCLAAECTDDDCENTHAYECSVCAEEIEGEHYVCLDDGSENAHTHCVTWVE